MLIIYDLTRRIQGFASSTGIALFNRNDFWRRIPVDIEAVKSIFENGLCAYIINTSFGIDNLTALDHGRVESR